MRFELMDSMASNKIKTFNEMPYNGHFLNISIAPTRDGAIISTIDVTELAQATERLREMGGRLNLAMSAARAGVWDWNIDTNEMIWDDRMLELYGYSKETFPGGLDSWVKRLHPDDAPRAFQEYQAALRGDLDFDTEFRIRRADGKVIHIKANGLVLSDGNGKPVRMIGVNTDTTDQKTMQEERQKLQERLQRAEKMEALGQLAGGVAHDLNNVLGVMSIYSELLQENIQEGNPLRKAVESILASTQKAADIVRDLLTLARRGVMTAAVVNLNRIVNDFSRTLVFERIRGSNSQVVFRIECDRNLLNIKGSPVHLEKTVMNLISNAAEAITGEGEVTIRTENRYLDRPVMGYDEVQNGDYAVLTVTDTGMGIPAEHLGKIFEPFFTKKRMGKSGTGLGLAIVWGTVKDHHGYIDVQSKEGKGSTFTLYFPVTREEISEEKEKISIDEYMGHGETILVVDDVAEQREVAEAMLRRLGYAVHTVGSGEEAVEHLKTHKADLLVLDMIMEPGMDGLETYKRICAMNPGQKAIIVSGFSETQRVREAQSLGAGAYVRKPYLREKIGIAIRNELRGGEP
jgi:PAS domain S-box-containing protein